MNSQLKNPYLWAAIISFVIVLVVSSKDFTAAATIALAFATFGLAKDSSKNIEISKNNLAEERLRREMDKLIKPLYENRNEFEGLEYVHAYNDFDAINFWKRIEADKYLANKDLRELIEYYLKLNADWYKNFKATRDKIKDAYWGDQVNLSNPYARSSELMDRIRYLPRNDLKEEQLNYINELLKKIDSEHEIIKYLNEYKSLIEKDTELEPIRLKLLNSVINRYQKLEEKIDEIHETLEKE
jgi:hypothetical protein